jgi:hypothetical protein
LALRAAYTRKAEDTDVPRAKIVPCFPSGTLKSDEQQSTVAERPLLPLAGLYQADRQKSWKMELAPFRCSVPHSPSLDPGWNKAPGRRVSQVRLRGYCAATYPVHANFKCTKPCGETTAFQYIVNGRSPLDTLAAPSDPHGNGFPIHAEPSNNTKERAPGQAFAPMFRALRRIFLTC